MAMFVARCCSFMLREGLPSIGNFNQENSRPPRPRGVKRTHAHNNGHIAALRISNYAQSRDVQQMGDSMLKWLIAWGLEGGAAMNIKMAHHWNQLRSLQHSLERNTNTRTSAQMRLYWTCGRCKINTACEGKKKK